MSPALYSNGHFVSAWRHVSQVTAERVVYYERQRDSTSCCCALSVAPRYVRRELHGVTPPATDGVREHSWSFTDGKSALMVVNPVAGGRPGAAIEAACAAGNVLREAGVLLETQRTTARGHARTIVGALPGDALRAMDVLVVVGGDGTLREVADGLLHALHRRGVDPSDAPALAVVPAGSGNAVARSLSLADAMTAALCVVHSLRTGRAANVCLLRYARPGSRTEICVGGVQWGMIADIDQGTEWMRSLGKLRFDVGAVGCIAMKRKIRARIKMRLHAGDAAVQREQRGRKVGYEAVDTESMESGELVIEDDFLTVVAWASPFISEDCMFLPFAKMEESDAFDVTVVRAGMSRFEMLQVLTSVADGSFVGKSSKVECYKVTRLEFESISGRYLTIDGEAESVAPFVLDIAPESGKIRMLDAFGEGEEAIYT